MQLFAMPLQTKGKMSTIKQKCINAAMNWICPRKERAPICDILFERDIFLPTLALCY